MRPPRIHDCTQDSISKILKFIQTFFYWIEIIQIDIISFRSYSLLVTFISGFAQDKPYKGELQNA